MVAPMMMPMMMLTASHSPSWARLGLPAWLFPDVLISTPRKFRSWAEVRFSGPR
jgi:hypothetical protein